jgi:hypothetical protein
VNAPLVRMFVSEVRQIFEGLDLVVRESDSARYGR